MTNENADKPVEKVIYGGVDHSTIQVKDLVDMAKRGASLSTIAARCGMVLEEFKYALEWVNPATGRQDFKRAMEAGRAEFEWSRICMKDDILNDPETKTSEKVKIIQSDLKTLENWAPASRTLKIQAIKHEDNPDVPDYAELTEEQIEQIRQATEEADGATMNRDE